ncbi:MAG: Tn3 family transposase [bacterium]|nr:Tn3 family transposase [bacterium]
MFTDTHSQLIEQARLTSADLELIQQRRRDHNRLGFAYQLAHVRLFNRFPTQQPFEIVDNVVLFVGLQLDISPSIIDAYSTRRETIAEHQEQIRAELGLKRFGEADQAALEEFIFDKACRLEQTHALLGLLKAYLKQQGILDPADDTLERLIQHGRAKARQYIFEKITSSLREPLRKQLDALLVVQNAPYSDLHRLKQAPQSPSPTAVLKLIDKLKHIEAMAVLDLDLSWLNNNYQRSLAHYARRCTASRLRELAEERRYTVLVCFLHQLYQSTVDDLVAMYDKLMTKIENKAEAEIDKHAKTHRKQLRAALASFHAMSSVLLDESVADDMLRPAIFETVSQEKLKQQIAEIETWLSGKHSHTFNLVVERFSYLRQFAPHLLEQLNLEKQKDSSSSILEAVDLLRELNRTGKRKLPDNPPIDFLSKTMQTLIQKDDEISKAAWECAVMMATRNEIKSGNLAVRQSKRFVHIDDFFMPDDQWMAMRAKFFKRARLPKDAEDVSEYLTNRLNHAFDDFLESLPKNTYASLNEKGWKVSRDPAEKLEKEAEARLAQLEAYLKQQMRVVKLPQLLIEVDNDLQFTRHFMTAAQQEAPDVQNVCAIIATVMAHGCNIGSYTMAQLTNGVSYNRIKHITDWLLTEEAQRSALAEVVNAISGLDITQAWGTGKSSSSDGQRFAMRRKLLQRTYSPKFNDFALEFYSFVADNYAPFYSTPIECTDRDAAYVLDGLLYNESDLAPEEHYTDTHGYTEINFAAFALLGRIFCPRIKGISSQRIYRIDLEKDYGPLKVLLNRHDQTIHLDWICEQWDRMGKFYASLETGHTTASLALKRLNGFSSKNHFYRANRELGRIFKTEHILRYMSDGSMRQRNRRGLLKGEQMNGLARDLNYGKRGQMTNREWEEQKHSSSCLTLILACIIYWQAKEMHRVLLECDDEDLDTSLLSHISPVTWDNVILYGEYFLDPSLIQL